MINNSAVTINRVIPNLAEPVSMPTITVFLISNLSKVLLIMCTTNAPKKSENLPATTSQSRVNHLFIYLFFIYLLTDFNDKKDTIVI